MILKESVKKIIHKKSYFIYTDCMKDAEQFKSEREEHFGGKIQYMSYATLIGRASSSKVKNRGGLIFLINDILHFEDFERTGGLMVLFNQKEDYQKTEFSIDLSDISTVKEIKDKYANSCINGFVDENEILPATGGIFALFSRTVLQVFVNNQTSLFLDILDKEGFITEINKFMMRAE
jgi:hypothetical protein